MKKLILPFILVFSLISNGFAFDLDKTLDKLKEDSKGKISIDAAKDGIEKTVLKKIDDLDKKLNSKIDYYDKKIDGDINKVVSDVGKEIAEVKALKDKAEGIIKEAESLKDKAKLAMK